MKMKDWAAARIVNRRQLQATFIALLLFIISTPVLPAERVDTHFLPTNVRYTRNAKCDAVSIHMPPSTHSAIYGNMISPKRADMPLSQGDSAICFAYATADMISQRVRTEISALDVATKYYFVDPSRLAQSPNPDLQRHLRGMGDYRAAIAESRATTDVSNEHNPGRYTYIDML
jgi:hypothetical protein